MIYKVSIYFLIFLLGCNGKVNNNDYNEVILEDRPNVLVILTDDQGWGDFSFTGNDMINTPIIDKLKSESAFFNNFFVSPVCAPTRASFLTGRYALRTGTSWVTHRKEVMRSSEVTIAEILKKEGYETGLFGKWHNGVQYPNNPLGQGFTEFFGFSAGHWNNYFDTQLQHNQRNVDTKGYITDVLTEKALGFIERNKDQPFFCYIPFNAPHSPFQVPDRYFLPKKNLGLSDKDASVYAMCENIDFNVGRILDKLDDLQLGENTIIIFFTDNGPNGHRFNGNMKGIKASVDEGGVRVPLLVRWRNKIKPGTIISKLAAHIDILPTITDLCNIELNDSTQLDGITLKPSLFNQAENLNKRYLYALKPHATLVKAGCVRTDSFRFVLDKNENRYLYNMVSDPQQIENIADYYPEMTATLDKSFTNWFNDVTSLGVAPPPIPVGFTEFPIARLPAVEARLKGQQEFEGKMGWANDWIKGFKSQKDTCFWEIEVSQAGEFEIWAEINVSSEFKGATMLIETMNGALSKTIINPFVSDYKESPDRVSRGEVYEKEWQANLIGNSMLSKGKQTISFGLNAENWNGAFELKSLLIKKVNK